jgi:hypothetical protein
MIPSVESTLLTGKQTESRDEMNWRNDGETGRGEDEDVEQLQLQQLQQQFQEQYQEELQQQQQQQHQHQQNQSLTPHSQPLQQLQSQQPKQEQPQPQQHPQQHQQLEQQLRQQICPSCTYSNHADLRFCEICESELVTVHASATVDFIRWPQQDAHVTGVVEPIKKAHGNVSSRSASVHTGANLEHAAAGANYCAEGNSKGTTRIEDVEYELGLSSSSHICLVNGSDGNVYVIEDEDYPPDTKFISVNAAAPQLSSQLVTPTPLLVSDALTNGIVEMLDRILRKEDGVQEYRLCSPVPHVTQSGFEGSKWTCGYRNLQMLAYSLNLHRPEYRKVLFNGNGEVPDVHGLQSWIERAWDEGFDRTVGPHHNTCEFTDVLTVGKEPAWWELAGYG